MMKISTGKRKKRRRQRRAKRKFNSPRKNLIKTDNFIRKEIRQSESGFSPLSLFLLFPFFIASVTAPPPASLPAHASWHEAWSLRLYKRGRRKGVSSIKESLSLSFSLSLSLSPLSLSLSFTTMTHALEFAMFCLIFFYFGGFLTSLVLVSSFWRILPKLYDQVGHCTYSCFFSAAQFSAFLSCLENEAASCLLLWMQLFPSSSSSGNAHAWRRGRNDSLCLSLPFWYKWWPEEKAFSPLEDTFFWKRNWHIG